MDGGLDLSRVQDLLISWLAVSCSSGAFGVCGLLSSRVYIV